MSESNAAALVVQSGLVLQRVENETLMQISVARPRDEVDIEKAILSTIERHPKFADDALYEFQRGGKTIIGLSVVAAREVARMWRNNATRTSFIDTGDGNLIACGVFVDMETGRRSEKQVPVPRIVKRDRKPYRLSDDEYNMQARQEGSKMERNAILDCLPVPMKSSIYAKCVEVCDRAAEKGDKPVPQRWEDSKKALAKIGVTPEQALAYLKLKAPNELTHASLNQLARTLKAINEGETSRSVFGEDPEEKRPEGGGAPNVTTGATVKEKAPADAPAKKDPPPATDDGGTARISAARAELEKIVAGPARDKAMNDAFGTLEWSDVEMFSLAELKMATDGGRVEKIVAAVLGTGSGELFGKGEK